MTSAIKSVKKKILEKSSQASSKTVLFLNIILVGSCVAGLAYFICGSDAIASGQYKVSSLQSKISRLTEQETELSAQKLASEDSNAALQYAQAHGMVPAQSVDYVFENGRVALNQQ